MNNLSSKRFEHAVSCIAAEVGVRILETPKRSYSERDLWNELTCCILSSQVPYELARAAAQRINECGVLCCVEVPRFDVLRMKLLEVLSTPLHFGDSFRRYRFPSRRAEQIAAGFCTVYEQFGSLAWFLEHYSDPIAARAWMVMNIKGVGPKQASMFLRNSTAAYDLAVIDRHVLRYMQLVQLDSPPKLDVASLDKYERHEIVLRQYATSMGYPVGLLDWAIWIVMRAASRIE